MLWTLIRKELLGHILTLRLAVALVFAAVLAVLSALIGSLEYGAHMEAFRAAQRSAREEMKRVTVYSQLAPNQLLPPQPLSILCRGISGGGGYQMYTGLYWVPIAPSPLGFSSGTGGDVMKTLDQVDFAAVIALVLSFLAVVLGFDAICGERERGTLKQILANPVPRGYVIVAKLAGGLLSLWVALALAFVLALLVLQANPEVVFAGEDWLRLALFFALSCLFLGQVFSLSLMVSTFTRRAATALIVCLFAWLVAGVGYVNVLPSLARYAVREEPDFNETVEADREFWEKFNREIEVWEHKHPGPGEVYLKGEEEDGRLRYARPEGYAWMQRRNAFRNDKYVERIDERYQIWRAHLDPLAREAFLVDRWSILSPFTNYQVLSYQLARTTLDDRFYIGALGRRYRSSFIQYLRGKKAFSSRRWFSDDPPQQEPMIAHPEEVSPDMLAPDSPFMRERMEWVRQQEKKALRDATRKLDLGDMPRFGGEWKRPLSSSLELMTPGLLALLLSFGLSALLSIVRFLRYDPR